MVKGLLFAVVCSLPLCSGCAVSYPFLSRDTKPLIGQQLAVQNRAHLLSSDESKQPEIAVGPIPGNQIKIAELPEGTEIQFRSFWRQHRWYLMGGLVTTDYAWVTAKPPGEASVNARLAVAEFDDVFDRTKYRPPLALPEQ